MLPLYALVSPAISKAFWNAGKLPTIFETPSMAHCPNSVLMVAVCWYLSCFEIASKTLYRVLAAPSSPFGPGGLHILCNLHRIKTEFVPCAHLRIRCTVAKGDVCKHTVQACSSLSLINAHSQHGGCQRRGRVQVNAGCLADTAGRIHHAGDFRRRGSHVAAQIVDGICNVDNLVVGLTKSGSHFAI